MGVTVSGWDGRGDGDMGGSQESKTAERMGDSLGIPRMGPCGSGPVAAPPIGSW